MSQGILYIVATPIGNLEDITFRAVTMLKNVDLIAAEDTRHSQKLLQHYSVSTPLFALHDHNERQKSQVLVEKLQQGLHIALISDAGTPLISDPGYHMVTACRRAGIRVVPIPGPSALTAAISAAGLATDNFSFRGFLPVKSVAKQQALALLEDEPTTVIYYEAPRRVQDTLDVLHQLYPERHMVLAKELTKQFENFVSGKPNEILQWLAADAGHSKGEFVLMISGAEPKSDDIPTHAKQLLAILQDDLPLKKAAATVATHYNLKKNKLYQYGLTLQDNASRQGE